MILNPLFHIQFCFKTLIYLFFIQKNHDIILYYSSCHLKNRNEKAKVKNRKTKLNYQFHKQGQRNQSNQVLQWAKAQEGLEQGSSLTQWNNKIAAPHLHHLLQYICVHKITYYTIFIFKLCLIMSETSYMFSNSFRKKKDLFSKKLCFLILFTVNHNKKNTKLTNKMKNDIIVWFSKWN